MANIDYADLLNIERLPVDAQDVVTKAILVIAGNRAGAEPGTLNAYPTDDSNTTETVSYFSWPVVYEYEDAAHATLGCARTFALPEGVDPFLPPDDDGVPEPDTVINFTNPGSPSAIRDGDPTTYAALASPGLGRIAYPVTAGVVGFRLKYTLSSGTTTAANTFRTFASVRTTPRSTGGRFYGQTFANTGNLPDTSEPAEVYMVVPPDARNAPENGPVEEFTQMYGEVAFDAFINAESCHLFDFYPLILNETLLESIAKRQIRLPAPTPRRVTVAGYVAPDRTHTIVGWPGGDYTGTVAQVQYELGRTVIDFEQAGAPVGLPAEAIEAARERRVAIDRAVQDATYPVRMGERL